MSIILTPCQESSINHYMESHELNFKLGRIVTENLILPKTLEEFKVFNGYNLTYIPEYTVFFIEKYLDVKVKTHIFIFIQNGNFLNLEYLSQYGGHSIKFGKEIIKLIKNSVEFTYVKREN